MIKGKKPSDSTSERQDCSICGKKHAGGAAACWQRPGGKHDPAKKNDSAPQPSKRKALRAELRALAELLQEEGSEGESSGGEDKEGATAASLSADGKRAIAYLLLAVLAWSLLGGTFEGLCALWRAPPAVDAPPTFVLERELRPFSDDPNTDGVLSVALNAARGWAGAASFQNRVPWSSVEQHYQLDDALYRGVAPKGCVARFADAKVRKVWDRAGNRTRARYPHLQSSI